MTQLTDIMDIKDLDIKSLQEIVAATRKNSRQHYKKFQEFEERLILTGRAPSLSAYLLYEYQFNRKDLACLSEEIGTSVNPLSKLMKKVGIPLRTNSEAKKSQLNEQDVSALLSLVEEEIRLHQAGEINYLTENDELKLLLDMNQWVFNARVLSQLGPADRRYRKSAISAQKGTTALDNAVLIDLVTEEIALHRRGKIGSLSTNRILTEILGLGRKSICSLDIFLDRGLPCEDRHYRHVNLASDATKTRNSVYGNPFSRIPHDRRVEIGKKAGRASLQSHRNSSYNAEGRFFALSQQEGAVALLLEKYLGYKVAEGENFQVRNKGISNGGIDFLVSKEFLEWHPIIPSLRGKKRGDIPTKEDLVSYQKVLSQIPEAELEDFVRDYKQVLAVNYRNSRQEAVDNSGYNGTDVSLATNICELYDFIKMNGGNLPAFNDFKREFNQKVKYVKGFKVEKKAEPEPEMAGVGK